MLAFYVLEAISFFSSPAAPLLSPTIVTPTRSGLAQLWSIRAWGLYTAIQIANLVVQHRVLTKKERLLSLSPEKVSGDGETLQDVKNAKSTTVLGLIENGAFAPLIVHWYVSISHDSHHFE